MKLTQTIKIELENKYLSSAIQPCVELKRALKKMALALYKEQTKDLREFYNSVPEKFKFLFDFNRYFYLKTKDGKDFNEHVRFYTDKNFGDSFSFTLNRLGLVNFLNFSYSMGFTEDELKEADLMIFNKQSEVTIIPEFETVFNAYKNSLDSVKESFKKFEQVLNSVTTTGKLLEILPELNSEEYLGIFKEGKKGEENLLPVPAGLLEEVRSKLAEITKKEDQQ